MIIEYRLDHCPLCDKLCEELEVRNITFDVKKLDDSETIADLYSDDIFPQSAPVLKIDNEYYYDGTLFTGDTINPEVIERLSKINW